MAKFLVIIVVFVLATQALAQPGSLDTSFNPTDVGFGLGDGASGSVITAAIQSDGKVLIGGSFWTYNGTAINRIARLNADGTLDASFNPGTGADNTIWSIAYQPDGKVLIGGLFTSYNGTERNRIARLNADGSLDESFNPGTGASDSIYSIAHQPDGKVLIGGIFTSYNGTEINRIARLNSDGSLDPSFNPGTGANNTIWYIVHQPDGKVLIGGDFTSYNDTDRNFIARLNADGSLDASFNPDPEASDAIYSIAHQPDGKVLIGGAFTGYNGMEGNGIARLNADGSLDASFSPGTGADDTIWSIAYQSDGKVLIVGDFTSYNGTAINRIARLNADGTLDESFNLGTGASRTIYSIVHQPDGKVLIGGSFWSYNGTGRNGIARLNADGSLDASFNLGTGANNIVLSIAYQPDGKVLIVGLITSYNGTTRNRIARLNADGSLDESFNPGMGASNNITSIAYQPDGKVLIGGWFHSYNGTARKYIARLNADGSLDASFNPGTGANNTISSIAYQPDGKVLIGGRLTSYNGTAINRIARLNADGSLDVSFNPGTGANSFIESIAYQPDGKVLIGGVFTSYNSTAINRIARLNADGSLDASFNPGTGANNTVRSFAYQPDGKVLIGGLFTSYNGTGRNHIARLNADGSLDESFNPGTGANDIIWSIAQQPDGKVLIGGRFTNYNGTAINRIARLNADGSLDASFNLGMGAHGEIISIAYQPDGRVLIGGNFTAYDGIGRNRIARINGDVQEQIITFDALSSVTFGDEAFEITATATSGLPVSFSTSSNTISITGNTVTLVSSGPASITASQPGNDFFLDAELVTQTFCVNPAKPSITVSGNNTPTATLTSSATLGNQWYEDGTLIPGATNQTLEVENPGSYSVQVVVEGCESQFSDVFTIIITGTEFSDISSHVELYPNPVVNTLILQLPEVMIGAKAHFLDMNGRTLHSVITDNETTMIDIGAFRSGMILLQIEHENGVAVYKVIKK